MAEPLVIVGKGMAATRLVDELSQRALGRYSIAVIGAEPRLAYNRVLLSPLLAGEIGEQEIELKPAAWWRALVPTLLAGGLALAATALAGQPWQLFHVLALLLLLGVGVDYGIFLLAQPSRRDLRGFVSITLAAASTWLSFGLLALSGTPALRAFGFTLGLGIALAWFLTPFFVPDHDSRND